MTRHSPARLGGVQDGKTDPIVKTLSEWTYASGHCRGCDRTLVASRISRAFDMQDRILARMCSASKGVDDPEDVGDVTVEPAERRYGRATTGEQGDGSD